MLRTDIGEKNEKVNLTKQIGKIKHGKKNGVWQTFYNNGQLKSIGKYKNGKKEGLWKTFYVSGGIKSVGNYIDGKKDGVWKTYFVNGEISRIEEFENFAIKKEVKYAGSYGVHYISYVDYHKYEGNKHLILRSFNEGKNISEIKVFLNAKLVLKKEFYYKTHQLSSETAYADEKKSHLKKYWKNGNLKEIAKFDRGRLIFSSYYYENGQLKESDEWRYGRLFNIKESFDPNGKKLPKGNFKNGNGVHLAYDSKGRLAYKAVYKEGKLIKIDRLD